MTSGFCQKNHFKLTFIVYKKKLMWKKREIFFFVYYIQVKTIHTYSIEKFIIFPVFPNVRTYYKQHWVWFTSEFGFFSSVLFCSSDFFSLSFSIKLIFNFCVDKLATKFHFFSIVVLGVWNLFSSFVWIYIKKRPRVCLLLSRINNIETKISWQVVLLWSEVTI